MKTEKLKLVLFATLAFIFVTAEISTVSAIEEKPSPELLKLGNELFNTKEKLGVKFACILCHKQEKAIKKTSLAKLGDKLPEVINLHILEKAKGAKPLALDSEEMKALEAYIRYEHSV